MSHFRSWLFALSIIGSLGITSSADVINLNAQRRESQHILQVPGEKINHNGVIINPTPQHIDIDRSGSINIASQGLDLIDKKKKFITDFNFVKIDKSGIKTTIDFGTEAATKADVVTISGAYSLTIDSKGIRIVGYDETGAFYGIQTLRQLTENAIDGNIPYVKINDYPTLPRRGVVEGFYGNPWSHEVKLSLIDFYGKFKLNTYIYGPKDDPYHSCPNWRLPYPDNKAAEIKELVEACRRNRVEFVWAIHPGQDIKWNDDDYQNLVKKFNAMYSLGVRAFAIFFDDISGEGTNPYKQIDLLNRLNDDFIASHDDVRQLLVCPTDYTRSWANPSPNGSLAVYGENLHPSIDIFWTGDAVCSDITRSTLKWVNSRIKRPAMFWWNYPVTDYVRNLILQGPVYGMTPGLTTSDLCGIVSNPMEYGEASKLALYSVADYAWNTSAYNPIDSWERGLVEIAQGAADAYRTFAIHSCDTETGYRRDESWETVISDTTNYNSLLAEFTKIENVASEMNEKSRNKALLKELNPWLTEFSKLGTHCRKTLQLGTMFGRTNNADFWNAYVENIPSKEERKSFEAHKSGTTLLYPFYEQSMDKMLYAFYKRMTDDTPTSFKAVGSYSTLRTTKSTLMFDNDSSTYYTSGRSQKTGQWVGTDLGCIKDVYEIKILQGRNSVDDVDYFDHTILEYSTDANTWTPLTDSLRNCYEIKWQGTPVKARYVRIRKLESKKSNWVAIRSFIVNPPRMERMGFEVDAENVDDALLSFDKHPGTSYHNSGNFSFTIPDNVSKYCLLMKNKSVVKITQFTTEGNSISESRTSDSFYILPIDDNAHRITISGDVEIYEIIPLQ